MGIEETSTIDRLQKNKVNLKNKNSPRHAHKDEKTRTGGVCTSFGGLTVFWFLPFNYKIDTTPEG